jgi:Spy/CpxP family protein refolding chaperone
MLALAACSGTTTSAPPAGTTQQPIATSGHGPLRAMGSAFAEVPLSAEQRVRIEGLFKQTEERHAEAWRTSAAARKELMLALADQVKAGAIDRAALAPKAEAAAAPLKKAHEQDRAALVELHKALTPEQRAQFVDALGDRHAMAKKAFGRGDGREEHGLRGEGAGKGKGKHERFGKLWKELDLTSEQKDKLKEAMKSSMGGQGGKGRDKQDRKEQFAHRREEMKKLMDSFKTEQFTGQLPGHDPSGGHANAMIDRMLKFAEVATPILTPEQRVKASELLKERAAKADEMPSKK